MNWRVFKRDDPDTWPELDCPLLVCWTNGDDYRLYNAKWDSEDKKFIRDLKWIVFQKGDVFYTYIGYIPYIERELHPRKCGKGDRMCAYEDDGYCIGDSCECEHIKFVTEYSIGHKRIWKEF
jgi:hypothetical protein